MSTRKQGGKPIKITLTEGQISDIISQSAKTRRGLKAESLEDRIAPSVIGAPLDPGLVEGDATSSGGDYGDAPPVPPPEGEIPPPYDPSLPPSGGDYVGGDPGDAVFPPPPGDLSTTTFDPFTQPAYDPNNPNVPVNADSPIGLPPGAPVPPIGLTPGGYAGAPNLPPIFPGAGGPDVDLPGGLYGRALHEPPHIPTGPGPDGAPPPPHGFHQPPDPTTPPSPEELEAHRRNILRQLRGLDQGPEIPGEPQP